MSYLEETAQLSLALAGQSQRRIFLILLAVSGVTARAWPARPIEMLLWGPAEGPTGEGCQGAELMESPAFGPGHSQPLPSPAWEGLRAFLQPLVGPPRLPTLLAVDLLSSLGHSCCNSLPPPHPPAEVGPGKQVHSRQTASRDFVCRQHHCALLVMVQRGNSLPALSMHILYRLQGCTPCYTGSPPHILSGMWPLPFDR